MFGAKYYRKRGLLKSGVLTSLRRLFAKIRVNECNGDISTVVEVTINAKAVLRYSPYGF